MNTLNLIKSKKYYALIGSELRKRLDNEIKNRLEFSKIIGCSYKTVLRIVTFPDYWCNLGTLSKIARKLRINKKLVERNILKLKTKNSFPLEFKKIKFDHNLYAILGHLLGDGGIHVLKKENKYRAFYVNNEEILLNSFEDSIRKVFGDVKIYSRKRVSHGDEIWLPTSLGYIFYTLLNYKKNKNVKRVPGFIKKSTAKNISSFLQALYDDEGYVYPQKNMICISLANKSLLVDINKLVNNLKIKTNSIKIINPINRSQMYFFSITHRNNIINFGNKIGFKHPIKNKKLRLLISKYG